MKYTTEFMTGSTRKHLLILPGLLLGLLFLLPACAGGATYPPQARGKTPVVPTVTATPTPATQAGALSIQAQPTARPTLAPTPTALIPAATAIASTQESQFAQAVFNEINQERASQGLPALKWNNALVRSAHLHNLTMVNAQQLSHQLPGETDLFTRVHNQGIGTNNVAENIGYTYDRSVNGATGLNTWMFNEKPPDDGHRLNILTTVGTSVGVDVVIDSQRLWLTEDFAEV